MADQANADSDDIKKASSVSGSPWDDDLEVVDEEVESKPQIVGSFEGDVPAETNPVPFNVPEEVIEDKVGKKIPAEDVMGKDVPRFYTPKEQEKPNNNVPTTDVPKIVPSQTAIIAPETPTNKRPPLTIKSIEPVAEHPAPTKNQTETIQANKNPIIANSPVASMNNINSDTEKSDISAHASAGVTNKIQADSSQTKAEDMPLTAQIQESDGNGDKPIEKSETVELADKKIDIDPFADPFAPLDAPELVKKEIPNKEKIHEPIIISDSTPSFNPPEEKKSVVNKSMDSLAPPVRSDEARPQNTKPETTKTNDIMGEKDKKPTNGEAKEKKSILKRFGLFRGNADKKTGVDKSNSIDLSAPKADIIPSSVNDKSEQNIFNPTKQKSGLSPKLAVVMSVALLLVAITYLTEIGLISVGLEKIYGVVGVEKLWGGLPRNAEQALGLSMVKQKESLDFKYSGKLSVTVDKSKKSPVTSPLVSFGHSSVPTKDSAVAIWQEAVLSQYDYYDDDYFSDYYGDSTEGESETTPSNSTEDSTESSDATTDAESITSPAPTEVDSDTSSSPYEDSDSDESYLPTEPTIKQLDFEMKGESSEESISSSLTLKQLVGANKQIELMNSAGSLYVKSSDIKFDALAAEGKWLQYAFENLSSGNNLMDVLNINIDSGFSAMGRRVANEKVSGVRAYKYKIDSMELGDSLEKIGILKESISKISGYVWIGVKDHLLRRVSLEIVPSVSSSLTRIQLDSDFYDYNISNSLIVPALTNVVKVESTASAESNESSVTGDPSSINQTETPPTNQGTSISESQDDRTDNDAKRHQDLLAIKNALNSYKARYGQYPKSFSFTNVNNPNNIIKQSLVPAYINSIPNDPNFSAGWWYGYKSDGRSFTLSARFENINDREVTKIGGVYLHYVWN